MEKAIFGAESFFSNRAFLTGVRGVENIRVKYVTKLNLEIIEISYNPWKVSYTELLDLFFELHDAANQNQKHQSVIFFETIHQLKAAKQKKTEINKIGGKVLTDITPVKEYDRLLVYQQHIS